MHTHTSTQADTGGIPYISGFMQCVHHIDIHRTGFKYITIYQCL